jgi:hypothetical protein
MDKTVPASEPRTSHAKLVSAAPSASMPNPNGQSGQESRKSIQKSCVHAKKHAATKNIAPAMRQAKNVGTTAAARIA